MMNRITTAARRQIAATEGGLLAHPWMTTAGLVAVNVALAVALVVPPSVVGAEQQGPRPFCAWCYEGYYARIGQVGHSTGRFWLSKRVEYISIFHPSDRVYPGTCLEAHRYAVCCVLPD